MVKQLELNFLDYIEELNSEKLEIIKKRNKKYGNNFENFGKIMQAIFPDGIKPQEVVDWNRMGVFVQIVAKLTRYANNFNDGGHKDSLDDLANYCDILNFLDKKENGRKK